jgi:hypothetical protein
VSRYGTPHGCRCTRTSLGALLPLDWGDRSKVAKARAQKRAAGTRRCVLRVTGTLAVFVLILRSARAEAVQQIRTCVRASRRMRTSYRVRPHASRRIAAYFGLGKQLRSGCAAMLLVLARIAIVQPFREEWPGPGSRLGRAAGRRIGCSRAARAAAERDRDRLFIGPGWLKEPRVRITRKDRGR